MNLTRPEAQDLARRIVDAICGWRSFRAALIGGGVETAFELKVGQVLDQWLCERRGDRVLVPQHKAAPVASRERADYAICTDPGRGFDVGVAAVIEVKGNYASQSRELTGLRTRPPGGRTGLPRLAKAAVQAARYADSRCAAAGPVPPAYVIYLLAAAAEAPPAGARGTGLAHFDARFAAAGAFQSAVDLLRMANAESAFCSAAVCELGCFQNGRLFCGIYRADAAFCGLLSGLV